MTLAHLSDPMLDMDIQELASLTTGDADVENFERLFSKLKEMKGKLFIFPHLYLNARTFKRNLQCNKCSAHVCIILVVNIFKVTVFTVQED